MTISNLIWYTDDAMGIYEKDLFGESKYEKSIRTLKSFCKSPDGTWKKVLCAFSGGKDSQCCYHLLKDAEIPFVAQYSITRFKPPELKRRYSTLVTSMTNIRLSSYLVVTAKPRR